MNLYIFHTSSEAAVYGIGTYIRELTTALRHSKIKVCVVNKGARTSNANGGDKRWHKAMVFSGAYRTNGD